MALPPEPRYALELFAGVGGLALGLTRAVAGLRTVGYVERDVFAASVLVARMAEASLDPAPVWDDVATFDGRAWCGVVDLVAGGSPCQDLSGAGKRRGLDGERSSLFFEQLRVAVEAESPWFFWENVASGETGRALPRVVGAIRDAGYVVAEGPDGRPYVVLGADDVEAPHRRLRVFVLAYSPRFGRAGRSGVIRRGWSEPENSGSAVADHHRAELRDEPGRCDGESRGPAPVSGDARETVADANALRELQPRGGERHERGRTGDGGSPMAWPPGPDDVDGWRRVLSVRPDLAPAIGRPPQPAFRGVAHGPASRVDRLRALGNGVVPAQAALAWRLLYKHFERDA